MTAQEPTPSREPARTTKPRLNAAVSAAFALLYAVLAVGLFWATGISGAFVGPATSSAVVAVLTAVLAVLAFRIPLGADAARAVAGPLQLFTILTAVAGFATGLVGVIVGVATGEGSAMVMCISIFLGSLVAAVNGLLLYGAARHSSS